MKNMYKWLVGAVAVTTAMCAYKPFNNTIEIDNVGKRQVYEIGNNSCIIPPDNVKGKIEGELDGDAIVIVSDKDVPLNVIATQISKLKRDEYYPSEYRIYLSKGEVNKEFWFDYYKNYYRDGPGHIYYVPLGAKQGNIKINWSI